MSRPLIGLSTYREPARWGAWLQDADLLPHHYARSITLAGGIPVLLPPTEPYEASAIDVLSPMDGLVITGGPDVDPARYGASPHTATGRPRHERDAWEFALLDAAVASSMPVLGICRGMQVMAVHAGGQLDQHVPDLVANTHHYPAPAVYGRIKVAVTSGSLLESLVGAQASVSCHHHQSVREHPGFDAVARSEDGLMEAMEDPSHRFRLGVQWHPEVDPDRGLFRGLVDAAGAWR